MREARKIAVKQNWDDYDKAEVKEKLRKKLLKELAEKIFWITENLT